MSNSNTFCATIMYLDQAGDACIIRAIVLAVDQQDAINAAVETVAALPDCAKVVGVRLEQLPDEIMAEAVGLNAQDPNAHPAGHTLH